MRAILIILTILIFSVTHAGDNLGNMREKPKILILCQKLTKGEDYQKINETTRSFEDAVESQIRKEIPCASVMTYTTIQEMVAFDRTAYTLNPDNGSHLEEILQNLQADIIISLLAYKVGDTYTFNAGTLSTRKASILDKNTSTGNKDIYDYGEIARLIVQDLLASEICPYKGEITFSSVKTFKDSEERKGLPGQDCDFKATKSRDDKLEETWTFQKVKRIQAEANVNYSINNIKSEEEHNTCNHCQVKEGDYFLDQFEPNKANMNFSTVITEKYNANKIANLDPKAKYEKCNAEVKIAFNILANNYTIQVKAISEPAKLVKKTVHKESGCPYHKGSEYEEEATYPVPCEKTFGPFIGSPYQKNLKQNVTNTYIDPDSNGKGQTIENITFNLTR